MRALSGRSRQGVTWISRGRTLIPTATGDVVSTFIEGNFGEYISDTFTAEMENELDEIAEGKRKYEKNTEGFLRPVHQGD